MKAMNQMISAALAAAAFISLSVGASAQLTSAGDADDVAQQLKAAQTSPQAGGDDPWEGFNRKMFATNNTFDRALFVPAAKGYRALTHKKQRKGLRNLFANARTPVIFINNVLQGDFKRAGDTMGRFVINTTIGFGGMGDPAERLGIEQHSEDFGQTLAVWGAGPGPYVVLPFFGPSTVRDGFGSAVDTAFDPATFIRTPPATLTRYTRSGASLLSAREPLIEPLADIEANSLDFYASIRSFYLQSRANAINNGQADFDNLPDIGDFEEFDEIE